MAAEGKVGRLDSPEIRSNKFDIGTGESYI